MCGSFIPSNELPPKKHTGFRAEKYWIFCARCCGLRILKDTGYWKYILDKISLLLDKDSCHAWNILLANSEKRCTGKSMDEAMISHSIKHFKSPSSNCSVLCSSYTDTDQPCVSIYSIASSNTYSLIHNVHHICLPKSISTHHREFCFDWTLFDVKCTWLLCLYQKRYIIETHFLFGAGGWGKGGYRKRLHLLLLFEGLILKTWESIPISFSRNKQTF